MGKRWSQEEIETLRKYYPSYQKERLLTLLKGRTWRAISDKAQRLGIKCKKSTRKALWRRFEEASKTKRQKMVSWYWHGIVETPEGSERCFGRPGMSQRAVRADFLDVVNTLLSGLPNEKIEIRHDYAHIALQMLERVGEESLSEEIPRWEAIRDALLNPDTKLEWWKSIHHDSRWIRLRNSFHGSREWREFRLRWLEEHPACARCGRTDGLLQVHHAGIYTLNKTVFDEGFLEGLHHPERFKTLCGDCHKEVSAPLIAVEKADLQGDR